MQDEVSTMKKSALLVWGGWDGHEALTAHVVAQAAPRAHNDRRTQVLTMTATAEPIRSREAEGAGQDGTGSMQRYPGGRTVRRCVVRTSMPR